MYLIENEYTLQTKFFCLSDLKGNSLKNLKKYDVIFIKTPLFKKNLNQIFTKEDLRNSIIKTILKGLNILSRNFKDDVKLVILSESYIIPYIQAYFSKNFKYQQWIVLKLKEGQFFKENGLLNSHLSLLIITKDKKPLKHCKIRLQYTYCPYCHKTTKDYGGKKHLFHENGTLISDIWKFTSLDRDDNFEKPNELITIIKKMFSFVEDREQSKIKNNDMAIISIKNDEEIRDFLKYRKKSIVNTNSIFPTIKKIKKPKKESKVMRNTLINGDAIKKLEMIPDNSIDLIFVDPPYNIDKKYDSYNDNLEIEAYFKWCDTWIEHLVRVLKNGGALFILNMPIYSIRHFLYLQQRLVFQNWIVWDSLSVPVRKIMPAHYSLLYYTKGSKPNTLNTPTPKDVIRKTPMKLSYLLSLKDNFCLRQSCIKKRLENKIDQYTKLTDIWTGIHRIKHNSRRFDHPTQLPPKLIKRIISIFSKENDLVLDCFNGVGTTTICAAQLKRNYIGIEISKKYYEISLKNHIEVERGKDPFRKKKSPHLKSKNTKVKRQGLVNYEIPKKELQLYIKELKEKIGKMPNREDIINDKMYPIEYFDKYFKGWGEVIAAARTTGMKETKS